MSKSRTLRVSRRTFMAGAASTLSAPMFIPASALGQDGRPAPSKRITVALIGSGGMGRGNTKSMIRYDDCQFVAACDVDENNVAAGKKVIDDHYKNQDCQTYKDFREVVARKDIDAVIVATTDHWHALTAVATANAGKHIYCQKPLTHLFAEGRVLANAVKKNNVIFQVGSQQRSSGFFKQAVELVRNGYLGKLERVEIGLPTGRQSPDKYEKEQTPPKELDYDFWCGPSKMLPYMKERLHFNWRWNYAYGGGQLMDWIGHHNDITHWSLDQDNGGPVEAQAVGFTYPNDKTVFDAAMAYDVQCVYADGTKTSISNQYPNGVRWYGPNGSIFVSRSAFWIYDKEGKQQDKLSKEARGKDFDRGPWKAYDSQEHHRNFLDGIKTGKPCICPSETGHRSITPGHLGLLSQALGQRKLKWDAKTETVVGDAEADKLLKTVEYRGPWKLEGLA